MINQQGTINKDTSETIYIQDLNKKYNKSFLNWFIGFCEGNENVFIVNRRYLRFESCVPIQNQDIIYYIKNKLGFGEIRMLRFLDTKIIEFSIQSDQADLNNLLILINIFNGNLRCISKEQHFKIFYNKLKIKLISKKFNSMLLVVEIHPQFRQPQLRDFITLAAVLVYPPIAFA